MRQPRASPPPRGDVTMPEPQSSWAGSAHSPVRTALIGRASAGRAGPVGGRTPSWPGLRLLSPRLRPRHGAPGPAPRAQTRPWARPRGGGAPGPAPTCAESWCRPRGGASLGPPIGAGRTWTGLGLTVRWLRRASGVDLQGPSLSPRVPRGLHTDGTEPFIPPAHRALQRFTELLFFPAYLL